MLEAEFAETNIKHDDMVAEIESESALLEIVKQQTALLDRKAARAEDLSGLPPTYLMTGDLDLFRDETVQYASRLMAAGVPVDLGVFPGGPHGFDVFMPDAKLARRATEHQLAALEHVLSR